MVNVAKIYSTLGDSSSLVPLAVKDITATTGMTAGSFVTGKEEGFDRFIDESGTEAIWLLGIPGFKWLFDKTVFKWMKLDSKFDARNLKDKDVFEKIQQYAPDEKVKSGLDKIARNQKLFKNTATAKFIVSTAMTIGSYIGLTKFKQNYTEKSIRKNLIAEYEASKKKQENSDKMEKVDKTGAPTFKGLGSTIESFAFNPVKNMWILDGAITGERLKDSRSPQEFIGYAIKEGFTLCFMYYAGDKIKEYLEKKAITKFNKNINLDAKVLEEDTLKKAFEDGSIHKSIEEFKAANTSNVNLYEFLHKNPDNMIVKAAKNSKVIEMYKEPQGLFKKPKVTNKIDTRKYIDLEQIKNVNSSIEELYSQYKNALSKGETSDKFFAEVKKLKRKSILMGIGTCMFALGVVTPAIMLLKRFSSDNDQEFHTKKVIREQLIKEGLIK